MNQPTRVRYTIVASTTLVAVLLYLDRICIAEIAKRDDFRAAFDIGDQGAGAFMSAFFFAYALAQVPSGWLADRFGARGMLTLYVLAWSVCTALTGWAGGFVMLILARVFFGLSQAGCYPTSGSLIKRWIPLAGRGRASSLVSMGGRIGGVIAPLLTAWLLADHLQWQQVLLLYGVSGVFVAALFWRNVRESPADHPRANAAEQILVTPDGPEPDNGPPPAPPLGPLVRNASMWRMCLMQFCVNVGWVFLVSWLPKYLKSVHGVDEKTGGLMSTLVLTAGICGVIIGGPLADWLLKRYGVRRSRVIQLVGAKVCATLAFLAILFLDSAWPIVGALAVVAFMTDLGIPATWAYMMDVGGRNVAAVFG
jgi:ACS family glucarate transporter-like MFS transporter